MFRTIITVIRTAAFMGVLAATAFLGYEYIQTRDANHVVETVKTSTDSTRKAVQKMDLQGKVDDFQDKVGELQHKTRPLGRKISSAVGPKISPSFQAVEKGERRMSWPALILVFVFGTVFVLLGKFSTSGRY